MYSYVHGLTYLFLILANSIVYKFKMIDKMKVPVFCNKNIQHNIKYSNFTKLCTVDWGYLDTQK